MSCTCSVLSIISLGASAFSSCQCRVPYFLNQIPLIIFSHHEQALDTAKSTANGKPKLIECKTVIGKGIDAVAGTNAAHGEAGVPYTDESRKAIGLPEEKWFVSADTRAFFTDRQAALAKS